MNLRVLITTLGCLLLCRIASCSDSEITKIWAQPQPVLDNIIRLIPSGDYHSQEDGTLRSELQNLAYAINQEIMAAESPTMLAPTSERLAVIWKWGEVLAPYTEKLVRLALDPATYRTGAGGQSRSLLDFAPPTEAFAQEVRPYLNGPKDVPLDAGRLLYEHRLLTDEDKAILSGRYKNVSGFEEKGQWAASLAEMGITDGLEYAQQAFRAEPSSKNPEIFIDAYGSALQVLWKLGPAARSVIPDLEYRMANLGSSRAEYISHFEHAHDIASGKKQPDYPIARNGSGWLDPKRSLVSTGAQASGNKPREEPSDAMPRQPVSTPSQPTSRISPWTWLMIALALAAVAFLSKAIRKNKS